MNSQQIRSFLSVAACKSFTTAAEQLYLSQSVVSYHVATLEREIGFSLFDRNTHGVELTAAGEALYRSLPPLVTQFEEVLEEAQRVASGCRSQLNICFGTPTSPTMMGQIVNQICQVVPVEDIGLTKRGYGDVLQPLLSGAADLLFTYPFFFRENLKLERRDFCLTWMCCMMHPRHPLAGHAELAFSDLKGQTILLVDSKNAHIEYGEICHRISQSGEDGPRLELTPKSFDQAQSFAIAGRGIMLVRTIDPVCRPNVDGLVSIPLTDLRPIPLIAVWRAGDLCPLGRKLVDSLPPCSGLV